jgi:hypothetical protein
MYKAEADRNDKLEILMTRYDGQVYAIEREDDGMFRSVVPSDVAEEGYGFPHGDRGDAERYLKEVIAECEKPLTSADLIKMADELIEGAGDATSQRFMQKLKHGIAGLEKNLQRYAHLRETGGAVWFYSGTQDLATGDRYDEYVDQCIEAKNRQLALRK